jgi:hypothetical protein
MSAPGNRSGQAVCYTTTGRWPAPGSSDDAQRNELR